MFVNKERKFNMATKLFDLSVNDFGKIAESGYEFEVTVPGTGEGTGAFITVRGEQSPTVKAFGRKKFQELQMKQQQAKRRGKEYDLDLEEAEDMAVDAAVVRVISWKGFGEEGKELPFTKENAERIFKQHPWLREQVMEHSGDLVNFTTKVK
jgi:hypothetical protein